MAGLTPGGYRPFNGVPLGREYQTAFVALIKGQHEDRETDFSDFCRRDMGRRLSCSFLANSSEPLQLLLLLEI